MFSRLALNTAKRSVRSFARPSTQVTCRHFTARFFCPTRTQTHTPVHLHHLLYDKAGIQLTTYSIIRSDLLLPSLLSLKYVQSTIFRSMTLIQF